MVGERGHIERTLAECSSDMLIKYLVFPGAGQLAPKMKMLAIDGALISSAHKECAQYANISSSSDLTKPL